MDAVSTYDDYLRRLEAALGPVPEGGFGKHAGRLIRRLDAAAYDAAYREYMELATTSRAWIAATPSTTSSCG